jgi:PAS domain-containing protein
MGTHDDNEHPNAKVARLEFELAAARAELLESRARLEVALDAGRLGLWRWDAAADSVDWHDHLCAMFGLEPAHAPRRRADWMAMVPPDYREQALGASSGEDGVRVARAEGVDVVLLDRSMPGQPPEATLAQLREIAADLPIIAFSGLADELEGATVQLGKPATWEQLQHAIGLALAARPPAALSSAGLRASSRPSSRASRAPSAQPCACR